MTLTRVGGIAALICGATYLIGFALLVTILAPLGYGSDEIDPLAVVAFNDASPGLLTAWNSVIYVVNAMALIVLVVALSDRLAKAAQGWALVSSGMGLVWAALVLGAGMIANVAIERAALLYPNDPVAAAELWAGLHAVELGLGGGNEIAGGMWIGCVSLAGWIGKKIAPAVVYLGLATSLGGLLTVFPPLGDMAGAIFGLGAIVWFFGVGAVMILARDARPLGTLGAES